MSPSLFNFYRRYAQWRLTWADRMSERPVRVLAWIDLLVADQGFMRFAVNPPARVCPYVLRSSQPTPFRLRRLVDQYGLTTVINLRGASTTGRYLLERHACEQLGLNLVDIKMSSRRAPKVEQLIALQQAVEQASGAVLIHCKSGADRAGLAAAVCQIRSGVPVSEAKLQLSLRHLHFRQAETGVLDHFLDTYAQQGSDSPADFDDWLQTRYDRQAVQAGFRPGGWASVLVNRILRRE